MCIIESSFEKVFRSNSYYNASETLYLDEISFNFTISVSLTTIPILGSCSNYIILVDLILRILIARKKTSSHENIFDFIKHNSTKCFLQPKIS